MRLIAFVLLFAASACFFQSASNLAILTSEEIFFHDLRRRSPEVARQDLAAEIEAVQAKRGRWILAAQFGIGAAALGYLGVAVLRSRRNALSISGGQDPAPVPDLETLINLVKTEPSSVRRPATHFYESRRARCRSTRACLRATVARLFRQVSPEPTDAKPR